MRALLSQKELAEKLDVNQSAISLWEIGKNKPLKKHIRKLCELFGCTVDELMNGDER